MLYATFNKYKLLETATFYGIYIKCGTKVNELKKIHALLKINNTINYRLLMYSKL